MSEELSQLKSKIEKCRKSSIILLLSGLGSFAVEMIMILLHKPLPLTFITIMFVFGLLSFWKFLDSREYEEKLRKIRRKQAEEKIRKEWEQFFKGFEDAQGWWQYNNSAKQNNYYNNSWDNKVKEAYAFLGLEFNSGEVEVIRAFRRLALKYHPDHGGSADKFKLLICHRDVIYRYLGVK